jgi:uroporphyrinogen-III synthase
MSRTSARATDLSGWTVIALRSAEQNAMLAPPVRATGAVFIGLPALRLQPIDPAHALPALTAALACPQVIFTSPYGVHCAARLRPLTDAAGMVFAVGAGTAAALRRAGVGEVHSPASRMNSEGLLALPALDPPATRVGLVGAAGGRGLIQATLQARGAQVVEAHVYQRLPGRIDRRHRERVLAAAGPLALLLTSAEALDAALAVLDTPAADRLRAATVLAASERLAEFARGHGFTRCLLTGSPRLPDMLTALQRHANPGPIR